MKLAIVPVLLSVVCNVESAGVRAFPTELQKYTDLRKLVCVPSGGYKHRDTYKQNLRHVFLYHQRPLGSQTQCLFCESPDQGISRQYAPGYK